MGFNLTPNPTRLHEGQRQTCLQDYESPAQLWHNAGKDVPEKHCEALPHLIGQLARYLGISRGWEMRFQGRRVRHV